MKKAVLPTCIVLLISSLICFVIAREYLSKRREATLARLNQKNAASATEEYSEEGDVVSAERLTVSDTVFLIKKDVEKKELTLRNVDGGEDKVLIYDGTTEFLSKRGQLRSADELRIGEILDVTFTTYNLTLSAVKESEKIWTNKGIRRFTINEKAKIIKIAENLYEIADNIVVASGDSVGELMDVTNLDAITTYGIGDKIYSILVDEGHGYIRIRNDSYFVGGWIEIGQEMIKVLTEDMLIPVKEGSYDIKVSNKGYVGRESVEVFRDKETILDLSKIEVEEVAIGHIQFNIKPDYAQLYVDGLMTDFEERVPLEYGIHSIRVVSAGYDTIQSNIKVGSEFADISISLDPSLDDSGDDTDNDSSSESVLPSQNNTTSSSSETTTSSSEHVSNGDNSKDVVFSNDSYLSDNKKINIEGPVGAEVYIDGTYIGIAPCSTNKVTGSHSITLSKNGYKTKTYSINVANDGNDLTLSFSELAAE